MKTIKAVKVSNNTQAISLQELMAALDKAYPNELPLEFNEQAIRESIKAQEIKAFIVSWATRKEK